MADTTALAPSSQKTDSNLTTTDSSLTALSGKKAAKATSDAITPDVTPPANTTAALTPYETLIQNIVGGQAEESKALNELAETEKAQNAAYDVERQAITRPSFIAPTFERPSTTSPYEAWASTAMTVALLGSAFTRHPMVTAMNSAAAAINAYQTQDKQAFDAAYKKFEIDSKNAQTAFEHQVGAYRDAMEDIVRREGRDAANNRETREEIMARYSAVAHATHDVDMIMALQDHTGNAAADLNIKRQRAADEHEKSQLAIRQQRDFYEHIDAFNHSTPELSELSAKADRGDNSAKLQLFLKQRAAGLWSKEKDPLADEAKRDAIVAGWEKSGPGKAMQQAQTANDRIQALGSDIYTSGVAQVGLLDLYIRGMTGGVPRLAQFAKAENTRSGMDALVAMKNKAARGTILTPTQVDQIRLAAREEAQATENEYYKWLRSVPERKVVAQEFGVLPPDGDDAATAAPPEPAPAPAPPALSSLPSGTGSGGKKLYLYKGQWVTADQVR